MASESKRADDTMQAAVGHSDAATEATLPGGARLVVAPECQGHDDCVYVRTTEHAFLIRARVLMMRVVFAARASRMALDVDVLPAQPIVAAAYRALQAIHMPCRVQCVYRTTPRLKAHAPEEQERVDKMLGQGDAEVSVPYLVLLTPPLETFDTADEAAGSSADAAGWTRIPRPKFVTLADAPVTSDVYGWTVTDCVHLDPRSMMVTMGAISAMLGDEIPSYLMYTPVYTMAPRGETLAQTPVQLGTDEQRVKEVEEFDAHAPEALRRVSASLQRMAEEDVTPENAQYIRDNAESLQRMHATQVARDVAATRRAVKS